MQIVFYLFGFVLFLFGVMYAVTAAHIQSKTERTEFRVDAICLMVMGIGVMIAASIAKAIGLY